MLSKECQGECVQYSWREKMGKYTSSHLTAKLIPPPPPTMYLQNGWIHFWSPAFIADLEFHKIFWGITHNKWWTSTRIRQPCIIGKNTLVSWHFSFEWSIPTPNTCLIQFDFIWPSFNKISLSDAYLLESTESREEGSMQFALNYITLLFLELLIVNSWIVCLLVC